MKVNRTWIENNFNKFNAEYFEGKLPIPTFQICNTYRMLGQCGAKNWKAEHPNFVIKISNYFDRTEKEFQNTLIHEMIHLHFQSNKDWKESHGKKFQAMARSFDKYGWNIHTTEQGLKSKTTNGKIDTRIIMTFNDVRRNLTWLCCVANDSAKIKYFKKYITTNSYYSNPNFYATNCDKFGTMRVCHTRLSGKTMVNEKFVKEFLPYLSEYHPTFLNY